MMVMKIYKRLAGCAEKNKITNLVDKMYLYEKQKFKDRLAMIHIITTGLDTLFGLKRGSQLPFMQPVLAILTPRIVLV